MFHFANHDFDLQHEADLRKARAMRKNLIPKLVPAPVQKLIEPEFDLGQFSDDERETLQPLEATTVEHPDQKDEVEENED